MLKARFGPHEPLGIKSICLSVKDICLHFYCLHIPRGLILRKIGMFNLYGIAMGNLLEDPLWIR